MSYPYPAVFEGYELKRDAMRAFARKFYVRDFDLRACRMLDAGCGEGFWGAFFAEWGFEVYGFDAEMAYIAKGRQKYPELELARCRAEDDLPYEEESFDLIFVRAISHFYAADLAPATEVLANLRRYVSITGQLLISAYTIGDGAQYPAAFGDAIHTHHTPDALEQMVEQAGWTPWRTKQAGRYLQIGAK